MLSPTGSRSASPRLLVVTPVDHVHSFLVALGRAVQRASVYPSGHPAAALGMRPLVDALASIVVDGPVTIAVGKTRLLVSGAGLPPVEHRAAWLSARLFEREVAVMTISADLDAVDLEALVNWLARRHDGPWPEFAGLTLSRFDGSKMRFLDRSSDAVDTPETEKAWWALTAPLRRTYGISDGEAAIDPEALGDQIRHALEAAEGIGISRLIEEIINLHASLPAADAESRSSALLKLALLVEHLAPEIRGTLFTITPEDAPEKLALVDDLLPLLSEPALVDIALNVAPAPMVGEGTGPFSRFLRKLGDVAADHPLVHEAFDRRLGAVGLPVSIAAADDDDDDDDGALRPGDGRSRDERLQDFVPASYAARMDELASAAQPAAAAAWAGQAFESASIEKHLIRMGAHASRENTSTETTEAYLPRLAQLLPREIARANRASMSTVAGLVLWLRSARVSLAGAAAAAAADIEAAFGSPTAVSMALDAIDALPAGEAIEAAEWLIAGGPRAIEQAMNAMRSAPAPAIRIKLAAAVMALDEGAFAAYVLPALGEHPRMAEAFAQALGVVDPARAIVCALTLSSHPSPHVRRRAMTWLLSVPLGPGKARIVLPRALAEGDTITVDAALDFAERHPTPAVSEALVEFLTGRADPRLGPEYARAVRILGVAHDAGAHLAGALATRTWRCGRMDRAVSVTMARRLASMRSEAAKRALRTWRLSPARLLSLFILPLEETL